MEVISKKQIREFEEYLILEEKSAATRKKYLRDVLLFALCVFMLLGSTYNPFIYFRF